MIRDTGGGIASRLQTNQNNRNIPLSVVVVAILMNNKLY